MSKVKLLFIGIPNKKTKYRGDGIFCNLDQPDTCVVIVDEFKAHQLLTDFPKEWELQDFDGTTKEFLSSINLEDMVVAHGKSNRPVRIIDEKGKTHSFPAGTTFSLTANAEDKTDTSKSKKELEKLAGAVKKASEAVIKKETELVEKETQITEAVTALTEKEVELDKRETTLAEKEKQFEELHPETVDEKEPEVKKTETKVTEKPKEKVEEKKEVKSTVLEHGKYKDKTVAEVFAINAKYMTYLASGNHQEKSAVTDEAKAFLDTSAKTE